ncbi:uncharacterized protein MONOS_3554 [Monocercomonoides exilis]|uniref:uncharacterized protein n=1 Tax=Monocercomonoides exilis TaxID=2049356 RepID=UPI00355A24EB|nr:hypothetical protein MONOS_3554 [Monocercomonoides exilis]|eukprot:MONOS_3554.1-p1 / transcript=MONOS_3554.1 / gene=MONOS_3554 / organism=Monocercomonoides_exilis_PA203 / gene_product=unspecified product / transcript_product=unspecified product / location=Mono_scaffold00084:88952-89584(-) / protein_length=189 / sequence_SO=supercontig / SO=protein_coding / is_pseudo=false
MRTGDESYDYSLQRSLRDKFNNLFYVLGHCPESEQEQKIEELNEIIDEMDGSAIHWTFTKDLFNKMDKMIEEKKLSMENAIVLLKHLGHRAVLVGYLCSKLRDSSLRKRIEKMIIEENEKKEGRKEKLMIDLCESYLLLSATEIFEELFPISVPCLLNVALKKEGNEKTQKEVEVALLALSCIDKYEV